MTDLIVIKLGGSLVTHKDTPLEADVQSIGKVAAEIGSALRKKNSTNLVLIHGGGSFGHYFAARYRIGLTAKQIPSEHISKTSGAMITLHTIILNRLISEGVPCKTVLASELLSDNKNISDYGKRYLRCLIDNDLVPVTFGNVLVTSHGSKIVSGDEIALAMSKMFRVKRVVFAMDVDGIYQTADMKGEILSEIDNESAIQGKLRKYDVTGGVISKTRVGMQIAGNGADVYYVNGKKSGRLRGLLLNHEYVKSTHIAAMRISR